MATQQQIDPSTKLPAGFSARVQSIFGAAYAREVLSTFEKRPTTFRVNTIKCSVDEAQQTLQREGFKLGRVPWSREAAIVLAGKERDLMKHALFKEGKIYLQSLASMVPPLVLAPQPNERILDLTAAPGSKTSQIAALMKGQGNLVAIEKNKIRYERLVHNLALLGVSAVEGFCEVVHTDGIDFSRTPRRKEFFDRILLDAPCSAESRFQRGDSRTFGYWSETAVKENAALQEKLLEAAWVLLKPGGILVYSTCTLAPEENELRVHELLQKLGSAAKVQPGTISNLRCVPGLSTWQSRTLHTGLKNTLRLFPTKEIESFFVAKIQKTN